MTSSLLCQEAVFIRPLEEKDKDEIVAGWTDYEGMNYQNQTALIQQLDSTQGYVIENGKIIAFSLEGQLFYLPQYLNTNVQRDEP